MTFGKTNFLFDLICVNVGCRALLEDKDKKIVELNQRLALTAEPNLSELITYQVSEVIVHLCVGVVNVWANCFS